MEEVEIKKLVKDVESLYDAGKLDIILNVVESLHPVDLAEVYQHLTTDTREQVFHLLDSDTASAVLVELDQPLQQEILEDIDSGRLTEIVQELESDDMTDLVSQLSSETAHQLLSAMDKEDSDEVRELLLHPEKSAGGIMAKEFVSVDESRTVDEAIAELRSRADEVQDVYYIFVVDDRGILVGFLSLKKLILSPSLARVNTVMNRDVISVKTDRDQEEVAHIVKKYDLVSIPVVDDSGILVGRITIDDVMDVVDEEASEDIHKMAGIGEEARLRESSPFRMSRVRLPWLITGLVGGLFAAVILSHFEQSLSKIIALSFFTPVIMSMGGSIGIQSSTIVVRGLATGEISFIDSYKHLYKEMKVSLINGFICSVILFGVAVIWQDIKLGILLGGSLFLIMNVAALVGALAPLLLRKVQVDPAIATGPFITISNDIVGLIIYFSLSTLILG